MLMVAYEKIVKPEIQFVNVESKAK